MTDAPSMTPAAAAPVTYPHVGTLLIGAGIGMTTFTADAGPVLPPVWRGVLSGLGAAFATVGTFLLGRSVAAPVA